MTLNTMAIKMNSVTLVQVLREADGIQYVLMSLRNDESISFSKI